MVTTPVPPLLDLDRYAVYYPIVATTDFGLGFALYGDASDVAVYKDGVKLKLTTDYTVRSVATGSMLVPVPVADAFIRLGTAVSSGKIEVYGARRPRRTLQASAAYSTRDFNVVFSDVWATLREMWSQFTRAVQTPPGEDGIQLPAAAARAGKVLMFSATGAPIVGESLEETRAVVTSSAASAVAAAATTTTKAAEAAASATRAALFDPATYYPKTEFKATGVGNAGAPVKFGANGELAANRILYADGPAGTNRAVAITSDQKNRFVFGVSDGPEGGADAGSDFFMNRYNDAGQYLGQVFAVARKTGSVGFNSPIYIPTAAAGANDTMGANTAFVQGEIARNGWKFAGGWNYSAQVSTVDFLNLGAFFEIMILTFWTTGTGQSYLRALLSTDNGASFITTGYNGNHFNTAEASGLPCGVNWKSDTNFPCCTNIINFNTPLPTHATGVMPGNSGFGGSHGQSIACNALRIQAINAPLTGGSILVYGRN